MLTLMQLATAICRANSDCGVGETIKDRASSLIADGVLISPEWDDQFVFAICLGRGRGEAPFNTHSEWGINMAQDISDLLKGHYIEFVNAERAHVYKV